jgi:anti-sigma regulatory factor (Ser/Thr protein kinase)
MGHPEPLPDRRDEGSWSLTGLSGSVGEARAHARAFLNARRSSPGDACEDILIAVSELVSNAVRHAPGPCTLRMVDHGETVTLEVSDTSGSLPRPRPPDPTNGAGGFGWHLLHHLGQTLTVAPGPQGKTIRIVLPCPRTTAPPPAPEPGTEEGQPPP